MTQNLPRIRRICFLLFPNIHLLDLAGPAQVFYEANYIGPNRYITEYAGLTDEISSEQGLKLGSLKNPWELDLKPGDFIFIPGVDFKALQAGRLKKQIRKIKPWLIEQYARGVFIGSICSGSLILAETGLLDRRKCTSHWKCIEYFRSHYPKVQVQADQLFVRDRNIYTSAGMTSGIDMCLYILEDLHGPLLPAKVAREMVVYMRRNHSDNQETIYLDYKTHFNPSIHKVQDHIISHPSKNFSLEELAFVANSSVRNLTRLFKSTTGHSIVEFKNAIKLELARTLINNPDYTMEKIAGLCGFENARHLRRVWKNKLGTAARRR